MQRWDRVAIVGVGLLGGSIGLALRKRKLAKAIVGIGRRRSSLAKALARKCVTETTTSVPRGVANAQLIVICTPVDLVPDCVAQVVAHCPADALITDVGSTKAEIVAATEAALQAAGGTARFVGSHPIAGSEKTGAEHAQSELFVGRTTVVTPTPRSNPAAVESICRFWELLGARVAQLSPEEHDALLARTSHLPHLVASALAATTPDNGEGPSLTGSGWADTTRIAAGDPELWRQIFLANAGHTLKALADFETVLRTWRHALENANGPLLTELLAEGKRRRDAVGS